MKVTALLLCGLAFALATPTVHKDQKDSEKQVYLLNLFFNDQQPNIDKEQEQFGNSFDFNKNNFNNAYAVKQFQYAYKQGFLPRGQIFNYNNPNQLQQAIQLFDVFYFAKDYNTFYQAACWARDRINEGQFAYALSVAIAKRPDTQGIALPPLSEIYPFLYVNTQAIQKLQYYKQQGQKQAYAESNHTSNYVYNQQQKQQRQQQEQQGNQYEQIFNNQNQYQYDNENQANQYQNQNQYNYEGRVAYFSEDFYLNQNFAFQQIFNPSWFNSQKYGQKSQNRYNGESFYYFLQQILARYNLERYANDLPNVQPFQFNKNIQPGYNPQLQYQNGQAVPARPNYFSIQNANANYLQQLQNLDRRFADAVDKNQVQNNNGGKQVLNAENGVEILSNLVQANENSVNNQFYAAYNGLYGYFDLFRKVVGSIVYPNNNANQAAPGAIENNSAALRDPVFYQIISRIVNYFQNFKNQLQPYKEEQLYFQGVQVQNVKVDDLVTYFDYSELDVYNALNYQEGEKPQNFQYKAQQQQLNYKPFNYNIQVNSEQNSDAIVRVFIGPQYDVQGQQYSLEQARQHFVEIDRFVVQLKNGQNQIQRNSQQSTRFVKQQPTSKEILRQAFQGNVFYNQTNQQQQQYTLPQNLILPKGSQNGQQYVFAVAFHQYQANQQNQDQYQYQPYDNRPEGFPFDRRVQPYFFQQAKNIFFQAVNIYNKNKNQVNNVDQ